MPKKFGRFERSFTVVCVLVTFGLVGWCFYEYQRDLDVSLVSLKDFGEDDNMIMPELSLCLLDPFHADKFNNDNLGFIVSYRQYTDFLLGRTWNDRMLDIDFDNVTKKIEDYLVRYNVVWRNTSFASYKTTSALPEMIKKPYPNFVGPLFGTIIKCYGIQIPMNAKRIELAMKSDIFPGGIRPHEFGLGVSLHYPNQLLRSNEQSKWNWPNHIQTQNQSLQMLLNVNTFEVTQRRYSKKQKCNKNWKEHDFYLARHNFEEIGCRPVYSIWDSIYPTCNSSEKMSMALSFEDRPQIMEPCQSADKILFDHMDNYLSAEDYEDDLLPSDSFWVVVDMRVSRVKVIEQKRAYELQTLIGNIGGYIGLLLGIYYIHIFNP